MPLDAGKMKKLVEFKEKIEKKVEALEAELDELRDMLEAVNTVLLEKGFKRAEIAKSQAEAEVSPPAEEEVVSAVPSETENFIPLKAVTGELLANLQVTGESIRVELAKDKSFSVNTPPFIPFLVERVLTKMQERDSELARTGELASDKIFSYNIVKEGDVIREITINHVDQDRLRELKSSIRWTLEKMYEKMKSQS